MEALAYITAAILGGIGVFQLALALGAPLGDFAWGGNFTGVLPTRMRLGSAAAIPVLAAFGWIVLARTGAIDTDWSMQIPAYFVAGFATLNTLGNLASKSTKERRVMGPLALLAAVLSWIIAIWA